jgi:hypothetical protein
MPEAPSPHRTDRLGPLLRWMRKHRALLAAIGSGCLLLGALLGVLVSNISSGPTVIARGQVAGQAWRLIAWEQGGQLAMEIVGKSTTDPYSGSVGFNNGGVAGYWETGPGPANSMFYYGPTPNSVEYVTLTAPGYQPVVVRAVPLPRSGGLPSGRFFIADPPGPATVLWNVVLKDSAGHVVPFRNFLYQIHRFADPLPSA